MQTKIKNLIKKSLSVRKLDSFRANALSPMEIKTYRMKTIATSTITPTQTIVMPTQTNAIKGADKNIINILLMLFLL